MGDHDLVDARPRCRAAPAGSARGRVSSASTSRAVPGVPSRTCAQVAGRCPRSASVSSAQVAGERRMFSPWSCWVLQHDAARCRAARSSRRCGRRPRRRTGRRCRAAAAAARRCRRTWSPSSATTTWRFSSSTEPHERRRARRAGRPRRPAASPSSPCERCRRPRRTGPRRRAARSRGTARRPPRGCGRTSASPSAARCPPRAPGRASTPVPVACIALDLADLDAAVGHLAALEEPAGGRQGGVHGDAAAEHPVDEAEVGRGDVDDADRADSTTNATSRTLVPRGHARTSEQGSRSPVRRRTASPLAEPRGERAARGSRSSDRRPMTSGSSVEPGMSGSLR